MASKTVLTRFQLRRRTAAEFELLNEILLEGEEGYELDTGRRKVGDGVTAWNDLPYNYATIPDGTYGDIIVTGVTWTIGNNVVGTTKLIDAAVTTAKLADAAVTNAKLANIASGRFKARSTGGTGIVEDLSGAQATALLSLFAPGSQGLVAASGGGTTKYLRADGTWTDILTPVDVAASGVVSAPSIGAGTTTPAATVEAKSPLPNFRATTSAGSPSGPYGFEVSPGSGIIDASFKALGNTGELNISSGRTPGWGGTIRFITDTVERWRFEAAGHLRPSADNAYNLGSASFRVGTVFAATGTINTSDVRNKRDIEPIPNAWLDAWAEVEWVRYRFIDGERWHIGLTAQSVRDVFAKHGLDACEIGLLCYDRWEASPAIPAKFNWRGKLVRIAQDAVEAGDRWGLRYDQCHSLSLALENRERKRMLSVLDSLSSKFLIG